MKSGLLGTVLAGGLSSRFGTPKAQALLDGVPLIDHVRALMAPYVDDVVVIGERAGGLPDMPRPDLGPLGGIAAALDHGASRGFRCVLTIGCDMPYLPPGLIEALLRRAPSFCTDAPVLGHWNSALGAQLLAHLQLATERSVRRWALSLGALPIAAPGPLHNINTRGDLDALAAEDLLPA